MRCRAQSGVLGMGGVIGLESIALMESPAFDLAFEPAYGRAVPVAAETTN